MNNFDLDVPMVRQSEGNYLFGSRKIYAKIMNEKLVIRVGGGFMLIEEFLPTYGQQELDKINTTEDQKISRAVEKGIRGSPPRRSSPHLNFAKNQGRLSPNANRGSPSGNKKIGF